MSYEYANTPTSGMSRDHGVLLLGPRSARPPQLPLLLSKLDKYAEKGDRLGHVPRNLLELHNLRTSRAERFRPAPGFGNLFRVGLFGIIFIELISTGVILVFYG